MPRVRGARSPSTRLFAKLDKTAPVIVVNGGNMVLWTTKFNFVLQGTANDACKTAFVTYKFNSNGIKNATGGASWNIPVTLKQGPNTFQIYATDLAGNRSGPVNVVDGDQKLTGRLKYGRDRSPQRSGVNGMRMNHAMHGPLGRSIVHHSPSILVDRPVVDSYLRYLAQSSTSASFGGIQVKQCAVAGRRVHPQAGDRAFFHLHFTTGAENPFDQAGEVGFVPDRRWRRI